MAWKIHFVDKTRLRVADNIRTLDSGWLSVWNDDDSERDKNLTRYPAHRISKIEKVIG